MARYTSKHTGKKIDDTIDNVVNPNLLDNWYFSNPVDQRGGYVYPPNSPYADRSGNQIGTTSKYLTIDKSKKSPFSADWAEISIDGTTYYGYIQYAVRGYTGTGYGIDRWKAANPYTVLIKDGYLQLISGVQNGFYAQPLDGIFAKLSGKTVMMSVLAEVISGEAYLNVRDGNSVSKKITNGLTSVTKTIISAPTEDRVVIYATEGAVINVYAAKLELGDHQTLAHQDADGNWVLNEIPDYGEQLARCQRYLLPLRLIRSFAVSLDENGGCASYQLPVSMRAAPAITPISLGGIVGSDKSSTITEVRTIGFDGHNLTLMFKTSTTMAGNTAPVGYLYDTQVWLSAERL